MQKTLVLTAILAVTALPLAGCSHTWAGFKSDIGKAADDMTSPGSGYSGNATNDASGSYASRHSMEVKPSTTPTYNR